jgi:hypothetical protein
VNAAAEAGCIQELTVRVCDPVDDRTWDQTLRGFPSAGLFHTSNWARVLRTAYGFKPAYFVAARGSHSRVLLPVMEVDSWLTGKRGVSLPFTDLCPALGDEPDALDAAQKAVLSHAADHEWKYSEFRGGPLPAGAPAEPASFCQHELLLHTDEARLFRGIEPATQRAVRKAQREGLRCEFSTELEALRIFCRLLEQTRRRHGSPPQPWVFFESIHEHVLSRDLGFVALVWHADRLIAGAVFFCFGTTAIYKFGASDLRFQHLRANNLVMWNSICRLAHQGFTVLHFGRTALDNDGLRRYKRAWGARETDLRYFRFDTTKERFVRTDAGAARFASFIRRLPLPLSRLVGAVLYRHVG